jgi:hypothetical protein
MGLRATAKKIKSVPVNAVNKTIVVEYNKAKSEEELEEARLISKLWDEGRIAEYTDATGQVLTTIVFSAKNKIKMAELPETKELYVSGLAIGDFAIVGFPGEPFTEIGRQSKNSSKFEMTFASCCTNGYEGYYPMESAYAEGGYEAGTAKYKKGVAEELISAATKILKDLYDKAN